MTDILVLGAGIIGLSTAITLLKAGHDVTIWTKAQTPHLTSDVAAAFWSPFRCLPEDKVLRWSKTGKQILESDYLNINETGCINRTLKAVYQEAFETPYWLQLAEDASELLPEDLPTGYTGGFKFETIVIDVKYYMPYLMRQFESLGGKLTICPVTSVDDLPRDYEYIINCFGLESRKVFEDNTLYPSRGQVIAIKPNGFTYLIRDERNRLLIVPRTDDIILGAVVDDSNWDVSLQSADTERMISKIESVFPNHDWRQIISVKAGLRPMRSEIRLEKENINGLNVIHNYGHGGGGYTVAWGCAEEVLSLIE